MGRATDVINRSRKIVLKVGSNALTTDSGFLNEEIIQSLADQIVALRKAGKQIIVVSSGAEISGLTALGIKNRRGDINYKQAMCSIGQVELMMAYKKCFTADGVHIGQLLLTRRDFEEASAAMHIRNCLFTLLDEGVVPIINENDSVSIEEFGFGDNDALAALTANLWNADLLVLMSNVDGVFDRAPADGVQATLIREVTSIAALEAAVDTQGKSSFGTGGMESKISAAKTVGAYGTPMLLVNGKCKGILLDIAGGSDACTIFEEE
ncbi:MAG: glutamate 5-kinase [Clostridiales Family XIII bacterium]|jgi:glutamate 5-kinase|nr:glutamate 5-kinase [Clostridiales Family XIII bacterium]